MLPGSIALGVAIILANEATGGPTLLSGIGAFLAVWPVAVLLAPLQSRPSAAWLVVLGYLAISLWAPQSLGSPFEQQALGGSGGRRA
jgi:hypothetical protein